MSDLTTNRPRLLVGVELRTIAISLISSLRGSMIGPLLSGLTDARDDLATYSTTADYQDLARGPIVPSRLAPSPNEVLVDPISGYGDTFADLVSATLGRSATTSPALDPIAAAAVLVLLDDQQLPDSSRAQLGIVGVPSARTGSMGVTVRLESNDLMNRSKAWMRKDPTAGIGAFLSQSLATYLAEGSQALVRKKRNDFEVAFDQAILLAQPLVRQDITRLELTHQIGTTSANLPVVRLAVSPIPLPDGSPGRAEAETVLLKHGVMKSSLDAKFSATTEEQSIVIATQSAVVHPCVIPSYTDPIVSKWQSTTDRPQVFGQMRQARSLLESVPLPHESLEMIIRGWFVANWLGMVVERRVGRGTRLFVIDHEGTEVLLPAESPSGSSKGNDDDLPMIIEAYAIEEVLASAGASTLDGYFRLFELGSGDELIDFVATGAHQSKETPTDATEQNPVLQRFKPIEARLTERIQQAEQDASVKPKTIWRAIPRREALAPLLLRAYTTLLTDVAAAAPSEEQPLASQGPPRA